MTLYAAATSCAQGETLRFHLLEDGGAITVEDVPSGRVVLRDTAAGDTWTLTVGQDWPSSLYRAVLGDGSAYFVVRGRVPASPVVVAIPFPTWEAYNRPGVPGEGLYQSEQPDRAVKVSFDRPGAGPQVEEWELGLLRWLGPSGYAVDYCSGLDLHGGLDLLSRYRLLVINGHDEYWSWEMRDAVEAFARGGGNIAIFSGNTCWWQVRFEDDLRTMVCYRDAVADPLSRTDPGRTTVEWPSDPVNRPENTLTGLTFRNGAGCWVDSRVMSQESYTARFTDHWVYAGTGLRDGDTFGRGALGYETDAADLEWLDGVPRATGRDGTPPSFVVLATADLSHWRSHGKGGAATMGVHRLGAGTVFNAGTINWGNTLATDPVLARITRNVLDRLSRPPGPPQWEDIGPAGPPVLAPGARRPPAPEAAPDPAAEARPVALVVCESRLFAAGAGGALSTRHLSGQNLPWRPIDVTDALALAAPREAHGGPPAGLYGLAPGGAIRYRDPVLSPAPWTDVSRAPERATGLAAADEALFALTSDDELWHLPIRRLADAAWVRIGGGGGATGLTAMNGRLFAVAGDRVLTRTVDRQDREWTDLGPAWTTTPGPAPSASPVALAAASGRLVVAAPDGRLYWRSLS
ncbi:MULTISPECIES: N,N-dimethylformamidase beta subunit family domain-containing protein [unclassified Nonomuraea]|uniref:N,N-dimethylformamidase beta subunit family domain-containing protein n=1 Tax=unclassified Nonomuraea TaxID=2593643 RepID=UPI0033FC3417